jgi:hypothetical protein
MEIGPNVKQGVARDQNIHIHLALDPESSSVGARVCNLANN